MAPLPTLNAVNQQTHSMITENLNRSAYRGVAYTVNKEHFLLHSSFNNDTNPSTGPY